MKMITGYLFEDGGQNILQYFYKEKYSFKWEFLMYFKTGMAFFAAGLGFKLLGTVYDELLAKYSQLYVT